MDCCSLRTQTGIVCAHPGQESLTLVFCLATRRCMNFGPSFLEASTPSCRSISPRLGQTFNRNRAWLPLAHAITVGEHTVNSTLHFLRLGKSSIARSGAGNAGALSKSSWRNGGLNRKRISKLEEHFYRSFSAAEFWKGRPRAVGAFLTRDYLATSVVSDCSFLLSARLSNSSHLHQLRIPSCSTYPLPDSPNRPAGERAPGSNPNLFTVW
jgi:hypothetical protein